MRRRATEEPGAWPDLSVLVTDDQTAGRGRLGRRWIAPTGKTLAISLLLRPADRGPLEPDAWGWLPLLAGAAMTAAVEDELARAGAFRDVDGAPEDDESRRVDADGTGGVDVALKWPNDVLISGYKVCGVLAELVPAPGAEPLGPGAAVIVGAGLNLTLDEHDLPTLTSTSLQLVSGVAPDPDRVLAGYLERFAGLYRAWLDAGADAAASGLADEVRRRCGTLGSRVRIELPGDSELVGEAIGIDDGGRLVVRDEQGDVQAVAAGDVHHVRR
nr:biotin--[acetyl-CoA-carboxylase] ligase [Agromyces seonyuensis]